MYFFFLAKKKRTLLPSCNEEICFLFFSLSEKNFQCCSLICSSLSCLSDCFFPWPLPIFLLSSTKASVLAGREKLVKANRYLRTAIRWFDNLLIRCWASFLFLVLIIFWDLRCGDNFLSAAVFCLVSFDLFFRTLVCSSIVIAAAAAFSN